MNAFTPFYDLSGAGAMAATLCSRAPLETKAVEPSPFVTASRPPCPAPPAAAGEKAQGGRRVADALFGLGGGSRLTPSATAHGD